MRCSVYRGKRMTTAVRSVVFGAVIEVLVFLSVIPNDSMRPAARTEEILAYTLLPGGIAFRVLFVDIGFGQFTVMLPTPLGLCLAIVAFAAIAIFQAMVFAFP